MPAFITSLPLETAAVLPPPSGTLPPDLPPTVPPSGDYPVPCCIVPVGGAPPVHVPEPPPWMLLVTSLIGVAVMRKWKRL